MPLFHRALERLQDGRPGQGLRRGPGAPAPRRSAPRRRRARATGSASGSPPARTARSSAGARRPPAIAASSIGCPMVRPSDPQHLVVGRRVVAVDPDLGERLDWPGADGGPPSAPRPVRAEHEESEGETLPPGASWALRALDANARADLRLLVVVKRPAVPAAYVPVATDRSTCIEIRLGSQTPSSTRAIVIDAVMSPTRTSQRPGRKSKSVLSKVYLTIWYSVGSTHSVMSATLFSFCSISCSSTLSALRLRGLSRCSASGDGGGASGSPNSPVG